jgi:hypothetical protein
VTVIVFILISVALCYKKLLVHLLRVWSIQDMINTGRILPNISLSLLSEGEDCAYVAVVKLIVYGLIIPELVSMVAEYVPCICEHIIGE